MGHRPSACRPGRARQRWRSHLPRLDVGGPPLSAALSWRRGSPARAAAHQVLGVRLAAGLELDAHLDLVEGQRRGDPLVGDLEHVRALGADLGEQGRQPAGQVGDADAEVEVAPGGGEAVTDHLAQQQRVDVAPGQHGHGRRLEAVRVVEQRRDRGGAGRLDDLLGPLDQRQQGPRQRLLGDRDDLVDVVAHRREGDVAGATRRRCRRPSCSSTPAAPARPAASEPG